MNFSPKPKKNQPTTEKFYRSSGLFMQLGLVLALLIVYVTLEYATTKKVTLIENVFPYDIDTFVITAPPDFIIEKKREPIEKIIPKKTPIIDITTVIDNIPIDDIVDLTPNEMNPSDKINGIIEVIDDDGDGDIEPIPFRILEEAPIFPGCEGLEKEDSKACFTKQISKFVNRKFDASISEDLDLTGKQRIIALFSIDKNGLVTDIQIKAPHKRLEKEALRVIKSLPEMIPGKQRKKAVPVKYTLPIVFQIE